MFLKGVRAPLRALGWGLTGVNWPERAVEAVFMGDTDLGHPNRIKCLMMFPYKTGF
jgi:hypothetical protein